jgi:hypothetical protein
MASFANYHSFTWFLKINFQPEVLHFLFLIAPYFLLNYLLIIKIIFPVQSIYPISPHVLLMLIFNQMNRLHHPHHQIIHFLKK